MKLNTHQRILRNGRAAHAAGKLWSDNPYGEYSDDVPSNARSWAWGWLQRERDQQRERRERKYREREARNKDAQAR